MELPIYEYECTCCPARFEMKKSFFDDGPVSCPTCGAKARRRFSSVPIIFKGSGFYVTDSRGGQSYTSSSTPSEDTKSSSDKSAKSESKVGAEKK